MSKRVRKRQGERTRQGVKPRVTRVRSLRVRLGKKRMDAMGKRTEWKRG